MRKKKNTRAMNRINEILEMPKEIVTNEPKLTIIGFTELLIENYKGILEYEDFYIRINTYIGIINIPSINIELPIMNDWSNEKMKISSCKYYGSIYTNDLVLCSHSYDNLLGNIKDLNVSDLVIINDIRGEQFIYKVEVIEVLGPDDVTEMIENDFDLTLYTCTKDNLNRVTVRLNKI